MRKLASLVWAVKKGEISGYMNSCGRGGRLVPVAPSGGKIRPDAHLIHTLGSGVTVKVKVTGINSMRHTLPTRSLVSGDLGVTSH